MQDPHKVQTKPTKKKEPIKPPHCSQIPRETFHAAKLLYIPHSQTKLVLAHVIITLGIILIILVLTCTRRKLDIFT